MEQKVYFVYQHKDLDGNVFYIGKGTKQNTGRSDGYDRAYSKSNRSKNWRLKAKNGFSVKIIQEFIEEEKAISSEQKLISNCKECINKVILTNFEYSLIKLNDFEFIVSFYDNIYKITREGKIYNGFGVEMNPWDNGKGYKVVTLSCKGKRRNMYIHRLVAEAFIPNPENLKCVNHKDCNTSNNHIDNLEWCTTQYNIKYALNLGRMTKNRKKVLQYDLEGNFIQEWGSVLEASQFYGCTEELIQQVASVNNKKCLTGKGFIWKYKENILPEGNL